MDGWMDGWMDGCLGKTRRIRIPPSAILCVEICFVVQFSGQNHVVNACTIHFTRTKLTLQPLYYGVLIQGGTPTRPSFPRCSEVWKCVMSLLYCIVKEALARGAPAQKVERGPSRLGSRGSRTSTRRGRGVPRHKAAHQRRGGHHARGGGGGVRGDKERQIILQ